MLVIYNIEHSTNSPIQSKLTRRRKARTRKPNEVGAAWLPDLGLSVVGGLSVVLVVGGLSVVGGGLTVGEA